MGSIVGRSTTLDIFHCKSLISHAVRDLPSGGPTGCHGDNPPSGRTPPRDASSSYSERYPRQSAFNLIKDYKDNLAVTTEYNGVAERSCCDDDIVILI